MTLAHYEVYGLIDKLEAEAMRVRHMVEQDWRGKIIRVNACELGELSERLGDAIRAWHEEDENAPTVDEADAQLKAVP
jgi:hypothetical protein